MRQPRLRGSFSCAIPAMLTGCLGQGAGATCPESIADCLGEAKNFLFVASDKLSPGSWKEVTYGYATRYGTMVNGDACGVTARLQGSSASDYETTISGDLLALAGPGKVAVSVHSDFSFYPGEAGVLVYGVLATGGGRVVGQIDAGSSGGIDTSGTNPKVASCRQAIADMQSASTMLANLPATQELGPVAVMGDTFRIVAGPGVNVITTPLISLRSVSSPGYYYRQGGVLEIDTSPDTQSVVINAGKLYVGIGAEIYGYGDVIINVPGPGPSIKVFTYSGYQQAYINGPPILAPQRGIKLYTGITTNFFARQIGSRGTDVYSYY